MYNREKAVAYAHRWAYGFNPVYGNFTDMGGDCTNFLSQCLHAGGLPMNYRPVTGWFYNSLSSRAPAWTGVQPFFDFMTGRQGGRPYAAVVSLEEIEPGTCCKSPLTAAYGFRTASSWWRWAPPARRPRFWALPTPRTATTAP